MCLMPEGHRAGPQPAPLLTCVETWAQVPRGEGDPCCSHRAWPPGLPASSSQSKGSTSVSETFDDPWALLCGDSTPT